MTKENHEVRSCKIADKTGSVNASIWDEPGQLLQSGDIIRVTKGYASVWKNCLTLYIGYYKVYYISFFVGSPSSCRLQCTGKGGEIQKIGEFCLVFSELPNMSEPNPEGTIQMVGPGPTPAAPAGPGGAPLGNQQTPQPIPQSAPPARPPGGNGTRSSLNNGGPSWPTTLPGGNGAAPYPRGSTASATSKMGSKRDPRKR